VGLTAGVGAGVPEVPGVLEVPGEPEALGVLEAPGVTEAPGVLEVPGVLEALGVPLVVAEGLADVALAPGVPEAPESAATSAHPVTMTASRTTPATRPRRRDTIPLSSAFPESQRGTAISRRPAVRHHRPPRLVPLPVPAPAVSRTRHRTVAISPARPTTKSRPNPSGRPARKFGLRDRGPAETPACKPA
jgi:hypothetical protein